MARYDHVKRGWRTIGLKKIYARSKMEANFARYLQYQAENDPRFLDWQHEPEMFVFPVKRGCVSYLPDFRVTKLGENGVKYHIFYEVKGYMDAKSATKIKRFRKYFPENKLIIINQDWFKLNNLKCSAFIREWE